MTTHWAPRLETELKLGASETRFRMNRATRQDRVARAAASDAPRHATENGVAAHAMLRAKQGREETRSPEMLPVQDEGELCRPPSRRTR